MSNKKHSHKLWNAATDSKGNITVHRTEAEKDDFSDFEFLRSTVATSLGLWGAHAIDTSPFGSISDQWKYRFAAVAKELKASGETPPRVLSWNELNKAFGKKKVANAVEYITYGMKTRLASVYLNVPFMAAADLLPDVEKLGKKAVKAVVDGIKAGKARKVASQYGSVAGRVANVLQGNHKISIDQAAKDYYEAYYGPYGEQLVKEVKKRVKAEMAKAWLIKQGVDSAAAEYWGNYFTDLGYGKEMVKDAPKRKKAFQDAYTYELSFDLAVPKGADYDEAISEVESLLGVSVEQVLEEVEDTATYYVFKTSPLTQDKAEELKDVVPAFGRKTLSNDVVMTKAKFKNINASKRKKASGKDISMAVKAVDSEGNKYSVYNYSEHNGLAVLKDRQGNSIKTYDLLEEYDLYDIKGNLISSMSDYWEDDDDSSDVEASKQAGWGNMKNYFTDKLDQGMGNLENKVTTGLGNLKDKVTPNWLGDAWNYGNQGPQAPSATDPNQMSEEAKAQYQQKQVADEQAKYQQALQQQQGGQVVDPSQVAQQAPVQDPAIQDLSAKYEELNAQIQQLMQSMQSGGQAPDQGAQVAPTASNWQDRYAAGKKANFDLLDRFMEWHEDGENYRYNPEKFDMIYKLFEENGADADDVEVAFNSLPISEQSRVINIIEGKTSSNWQNRYDAGKKANFDLLDRFMEWHEDGENHRYNPEKFDMIYKLFEENGADADDVEVAFNSLPISEQSRVINIIEGKTSSKKKAQEEDYEEDEDYEDYVLVLEDSDQEDEDEEGNSVPWVTATISGEGAAYFAKRELQSIEGSSWESDGKDFAYALIMNRPGLVEDLIKEGKEYGYSVDDSMYTPFEA